MDGTPPEVLAHILSLTIGDVDLLSTLPMVIRENIVILTASGVCRRWRLVALGCGRLWGTIAFSTQDIRTIRCAELFLERSRGVSLSVHIHGSGDSRDQSFGDPARSIILKLSGELHRIRACKFNLPPPYIWEIWVIPAPHTVPLATRDDPRLGTPSNFINKIQQIRMTSISGYLKWPVGDFPCLTTAVLENKRGDEDVSVNNLLEPFDGTPNLSYLALRGYSKLILSEPFTTTLPALRRLDIRYCDTATLLNHLHIPSCTAISVTCYVRAEGAAATQTSPFTRGQLFAGNVTTLSVTFDVPREDYHIDTLNHSGVRTTFRFHDTWEIPSNSWIVRTIRDISRFAPFSSITNLEFYSTVENVPWMSWFACLPNVTTIDIALLEYTNFLGSLTATAPTTMSPLCPKLQSISVSPINPQVEIDYVQFKSFLSFRIRKGLPLTHVTIPAYHWDGLANSDNWWESMCIQGIFSLVCVVKHYSDCP
jgi:hypothetical protein